MKGVKFTGIMPALLTPFCEDNKTINEEAAKQLIERHIADGANGFYILGGTGEGLLMAREERETMCEIAVKAVNKRVPVICHVASINMNEMCELAKHAERAGADAIAAVPPISVFSYNGDDIYNYYKRLAASTNLPVIVYYQPSANGNINAKLTTRIFEIDNVTGVKWSAYNYYEMMKVKQITHGDMNVINGPDEMLINGLMSGADAGVGATYNCMMPWFVEIYNKFQAGDIEGARAVQYKANAVIDVLIEHNVIPALKAVVDMQGIKVGQATFPLHQYDAAEQEIIKAKMLPLGIKF